MGMRDKKRPALTVPWILVELAGHATMGLALGLGFSLALIFLDASGVRSLIAHSVDPRSTMVIFAATFALALAVGATLTGFVLTMIERNERDQ